MAAPVSRPELSILAGTPRPETPTRAALLISVCDDAIRRDAYRRLRHREFVDRQGLFERSDLDHIDDDPRTVVLLGTSPSGAVLGGVRLAPVCAPDLGWWTGSRLVVDPGADAPGLGAALVRAAVAFVESRGVLRFEARVQDRYAPLFGRLGWDDRGTDHTVAGRAHRRMSHPMRQIRRTAEVTKSMLGGTLAPLADQPGGLGPAGFRGDDGVPVPGSDVVAACDAIVPSMVERDPEWAGWCSVLVNLNDLAAMGAHPTGLLDAVGAPDRAHLDRVIAGLSAAARAWGVPVLGGHTQLGVPSSLAVTALGATSNPVRAGGGRVGDTVTVLADLGGGWRPGYRDKQWDSTSTRSADELRSMNHLVAQIQPAAAKDVSMAGLAGTLGMLAEASGTGAELDMSAIPRPADADPAAWLTCFPGFAMLLADRHAHTAVSAPVTAAACGRLTAGTGVYLRWPDGERTEAVPAGVTGLGCA